MERGLIWTGRDDDLEFSGRSVGFYDTTLRDGEQTVGVVMDPETKIEIAHALDRLGVQRIEAGFPRVSDDDRDAFRAIASAGLDAEVWGFSRAHPKDLEALADLGVRFAVVEAPVSDGKLAAYGMTRDSVVGRIRDAVRFAVESGIHVAFFGVDGTRSDSDFLRRVYAEAIDAGAREVAMVDTLGVATPERAAEMVSIGRSFGLPVHWHGHNDFGLATAAAVAAVRAGADWIHGTINGMGERAGNADLIESALTLSALYGVETGLRFGAAREVSGLVRRLSGYELEPWKPVVGENLFVRESGAVASQFHDPPAIEPFSSELVGAERRMVLGKKSGLDSIRLKVEELRLDVPEEQWPELLAKVKKRGVEVRGLVSDDEFARMAGR